MELEAQILDGLVPDAEERERVANARRALEKAATDALRAQGIQGEAAVQGSIAKDTWIAGSADMDCFLLMPYDTPEEKLEGLVTAVAAQVLTDARKKYAQHPYLIGERDGFQVDLVPSYRIESPDQRLSAVDRTPLHTAWVASNLDEDARNQVRLAKQWCKGVGVYGAETRIGGFSGYLLEVLTQYHGGFHELLTWATKSCEPRRITMGEDAVQDDVSPLVVVDPVDSTRNCAAAVTDAALMRIQEAATAYQQSPTKEFFHPIAATAEDSAKLGRGLSEQEATWLGIILKPQTDRLDIVFPQFQRAARIAAEALERAGFPVRRMQVDAFEDDQFVGLQWVTDDVELPPHTTHRGPAANKEPNASGFKAKWEGHKDAQGPVLEGEDGRLEVVVNVADRTPAAWLSNHMNEVLTGKHVQKALQDSTILIDPGAIPGAWAPLVADLALDRRPWQRT